MSELRSYGVIPIYQSDGEYNILLIKHINGGHWSLPKGTPEPGEVPIETARRELAEETGITEVEIKEQVTFQEVYEFDQYGFRYIKTNTFYIGHVKEITTKSDSVEIEQLKWVKLNEAVNTVTHQSTKDLILSLIKHLK